MHCTRFVFSPEFSWLSVPALPSVSVLSQCYPADVLVGWGLQFVVAMKVGRYFWISYCGVACKTSAFIKDSYRGCL